jgi:hypothetical protein
VGVPGTFTFKFKANAATENVELKFIYKRPWEATVDRTVLVNVKIEI